MKRLDLLVFLALELLTAGIVVVLFRTFPAEPAGLAAGSLFVLLGLGLGLRMLGWAAWWSAATFWALAMHVFLTSLPLFIVRLANPGVPFDELSVLGIPGPVFHRISEGVYTFLIGATIVDLVRTRRRS